MGFFVRGVACVPAMFGYGVDALRLSVYGLLPCDKAGNPTLMVYVMGGGGCL